MKVRIFFGTIGLLGLFAIDFDYQLELKLRRFLQHPHIVAIGEIGLNFER